MLLLLCGGVIICLACLYAVLCCFTHVPTYIYISIYEYLLIYIYLCVCVHLKVYRGKYRGTPVAIKLIFTVDLNPEIIHRVCKEAQLLSQINHPNVVEIFGVSVFPPSVCLVLEICHYGSLSDVIRGKNSASGGGRPPLPLTHADKMYLALGCARGLEALHSYSSTLCHRDVKSFNFLVDSQLNAKIADLELGGDDEADPNYLSTTEKQFVFGGGGLRRSPASSSSNLSLGDDTEDVTRLSVSSSGDNMVTQRTSFRSNKSGRSRSSRTSGLKRVSRKLFGTQDKDEEFLCTWQAPEVMISAPHTQASDIYSLGLVLWEIISGLVPFENTLMQEDIRTLVLSGKRPAMPPCADSKYVQVIKNCWKADWSGRPDIKSVVSTLTLCWEASMHRYLFATSYVCNLQDIRRHYENQLERSSMATTRFSMSGSHTDDYQSRRSTSFGKQPLSAAAAKAAAYLQNEPRLHKLQTLTEIEKSAYIIVTPDAPHLVLWISKYIPKILGYFHNDLVCGDLSCICGPSTNRFFLRTMLQEAGEGKTGHRLITFYRRDGSQFINSLHVFPIFALSSPRDSGDSISLRTSGGNDDNDNGQIGGSINPFLSGPIPSDYLSPSSALLSASTGGGNGGGRGSYGSYGSQVSQASPVAGGGYMDAITRSLAVARQTTAEGREYTPTPPSSPVKTSHIPLLLGQDEQDKQEEEMDENLINSSPTGLVGDDDDNNTKDNTEDNTKAKDIASVETTPNDESDESCSLLEEGSGSAASTRGQEQEQEEEQQQQGREKEQKQVHTRQAPHPSSISGESVSELSQGGGQDVATTHTLRPAGDVKLDAIIQQALPDGQGQGQSGASPSLSPLSSHPPSSSSSGSSSSPAADCDLSIRQKKALSLDLGTDPSGGEGEGGRGSDSLPTKVAYVILQFNVVQDLRT